MFKVKAYNAVKDKFEVYEGRHWVADFDTKAEAVKFSKQKNKELAGVTTEPTTFEPAEVEAVESATTDAGDKVNLVSSEPEPEPEPEQQPEGLNSLFKDFEIPTIQDKEPEPLEKIADKLTSTDEDLDIIEEIDEESRKQSAKLNSLLIVECVDILINLLCKYLTDDFSKENDQKFSISETKKTAIKKPLYLILLQRKKQVNPVWGLVGAISLSYLPLLLTAFSIRMNKKKIEKTDGEAFNELQFLEAQRAAQSINERPQNIPVEKINIPVNKIKGKRGRPRKNL